MTGDQYSLEKNFRHRLMVSKNKTDDLVWSIDIDFRLMPCNHTFCNNFETTIRGYGELARGRRVDFKCRAHLSANGSPRCQGCVRQSCNCAAPPMPRSGQRYGLPKRPAVRRLHRSAGLVRGVQAFKKRPTARDKAADDFRRYLDPTPLFGHAALSVTQHGKSQIETRCWGSELLLDALQGGDRIESKRPAGCGNVEIETSGGNAGRGLGAQFLQQPGLARAPNIVKRKNGRLDRRVEEALKKVLLVLAVGKAGHFIRRRSDAAPWLWHVVPSLVDFDATRIHPLGSLLFERCVN